MRVDEHKSRRVTAFVVVVLLHLLVLWWLAITREATLIASEPLIELQLFSGSPPATSGGQGSAAASAPSSVHVPQVVLKPFADGFPAPPEPAPQQPEVLGQASTGEPAPVLGGAEQGAGAGLGTGTGIGTGGGARHGLAEAGGGVDGNVGTGSGTGTGIGPGIGAGVGASSGLRWVRELTAAEKREIYPSLAARRRISGEAVILCRINRDTTVTHCRDESEQPTGQGFGRAAVRAARYMRIRPRVVNGVVQDGARERITVPFVWTKGVSPDDALPR